MGLCRRKWVSRCEPWGFILWSYSLHAHCFLAADAVRPAATLHSCCLPSIWPQQWEEKCRGQHQPNPITMWVIITAGNPYCVFAQAAHLAKSFTQIISLNPRNGLMMYIIAMASVGMELKNWSPAGGTNLISYRIFGTVALQVEVGHWRQAVKMVSASDEVTTFCFLPATWPGASHRCHQYLPHQGGPISLEIVYQNRPFLH